MGVLSKGDINESKFQSMVPIAMGIISSVVLGLVISASEDIYPPELVMNYGDYKSTVTMIDDSEQPGNQMYTVAR